MNSWRIPVLAFLVAASASCLRRCGERESCALLDSDGDRLPDDWEVAKYRTDPRSVDTDGDGVADGDWLERREYTQTLRVILEFGVPVEAGALDTIFQDVRLLERRAGVSELEVVLYPGAADEPVSSKYSVANRCVAIEDGSAVDPDFAAEMRAIAGGGGTGARDRAETLLRRVFSETKRNVPFNAFYLSKDAAGEVSVPPGLSRVLSDREVSPRELWDRELDPWTMWTRRARGECTSSAVLGAAALSAIGVQSRLALFIPVGVAPDPVLQDIWDRRVWAGFDPRTFDRSGCVSHTTVEALVEDRWLLTDEERVRASPFQLGFGPLIQIRTAPSISTLIDPELWGAACAGQGPLEGTRNVYRILRIADAWGRHTSILEPLPLVDVFPFTSPKRPAFIPEDAIRDPARYFLARAEIGSRTHDELIYFYRCAVKTVPPFRAVRGFWREYFLLEKLDGQPTELSPEGCRFELDDADFEN